MTHTNLIRLVFVAVFVRLLLLAFSPLMDTTEARYAEVARLMVELNDWVTPWFTYDVPFWGKPPLSFWVTAVSFNIFGINEFAARFPHWLAGMIVLWIVWGMKSRSDATDASYPVVLLIGSVMFFIATGAVMTDMVLVIGTTLCMRGFWNGLYGALARRRSERWLLFIGMGIALLAKGPVGIVLAGLACGLWTLISGNLRSVWRDLPWIRGGLITLAIALPWYVIAELRSPGFIDYFIVGEHFHRFVTPGWSGDLYGKAHANPYGTIWLYLIVVVMPWTILLPILAWQTRGSLTGAPPVQSTASSHHTVDSDSNVSAVPFRNYLILWAFMPAFFFTMAGNIIWPYVLPGLPALALLMGGWLTTRANQKIVRLNLAIGLLITITVTVSFNISMPLTGRSTNLAAKTLIEDYQSQMPGDRPLIYLGQRPFSAAFYSRGHAQLEKTPEALVQRLNTTPAYVAIRSSYLTYMPPALLESLDRLSVHGHFTLFVTKSSHIVPPG